VTALDALLAAGRAAASGLQRERIRLWLPGPGVFNRDTGTTTPEVAADYYTGLARVKASSASTGQEVEAGEKTVTLRDFVVSLPWDADVSGRPVVGALVDVLASPEARMVGLRLWVTDVEFGSTATAWRLRAEDRS
jgi:hypothetical protein